MTTSVEGQRLRTDSGEVRTMCAAFQATIAEHPDWVALRTSGDAVRITWREYGERVRRIAAGLHAVGLRRGDTLALMLTTRPEFHLVDCAAMHLGAVPFSVYNTSSPEQVDYFLHDSGARIAVVESSLRDRVKAEQVLVVEELADLEAHGSGAGLDFDGTWQAVELDDPLTLIYTSGTTGDPKAVQITHRNMVFTSRSYDKIIGCPRGGNVVSYLPMAHIAERNCSHYYPMLFAFRVTSCPDARQVISYFPEVRPTWFFAVPRIFEKFQAAILSSAGDQLHGAIDRALARPPGQPGSQADEELLAGLRERLGLDQIKGLNVGAAPMRRPGCASSTRSACRSASCGG